MDPDHPKHTMCMALGRVRDLQQLELPVSRTPTQQLPLPFYGETIDVDGLRDAKCPDVTYWGQATCVFDNTYQCCANVNGVLCVVEISVTRQP